MLHRALVGSLVLLGAACGTLTGLDDLETDPNLGGGGTAGSAGTGGNAGSGGSGGMASGGSAGSAGSGGIQWEVPEGCDAVPLVEKVGVVLLVARGMSSVVRTNVKNGVLQERPFWSDTYAALDILPQENSQSCGDPLSTGHPIVALQRASDTSFLADTDQFFKALSAAPGKSDSPELSLRYARRTFEQHPELEARAAIVVTDAQEEGCDFSWGTSQATASDMLGSSPYARTYVTAFSDLVDHTHVLIEVGGALPLQGVSADFPDMLEHAARELHECTLRFDHTTQSELAMNGRRVMYTPSLDQCAFNQDEGYYPAGDGVINLCPFTCNTLVQDRRAEDVHAVIALCPD